MNSFKDSCYNLEPNNRKPSPSCTSPRLAVSYTQNSKLITRNSKLIPIQNIGTLENANAILRSDYRRNKNNRPACVH